MDEEGAVPTLLVRVFQLFIAANVAFYCYLGYDNIVNRPKREAARQLEIDTFYYKHNCRPEGYVPTKYEPVRTYRCDNGLFLAKDMK